MNPKPKPLVTPTLKKTPSSALPLRTRTPVKPLPIVSARQVVPVKEPLKSARIKGPGSDSSRRVGVSKTPDRKGPGIPPSKSPVRGPKLGFLEGGLAPPSKSPVRGPKLALLEGEVTVPRPIVPVETRGLRVPAVVLAMVVRGVAEAGRFRVLAEGFRRLGWEFACESAGLRQLARRVERRRLALAFRILKAPKLFSRRARMEEFSFFGGQPRQGETSPNPRYPPEELQPSLEARVSIYLAQKVKS